ncbi:ankyrin repeat domain-containing protein 13B-like [Salvia hispanica]|uniref:ankyrin repeat domain-containing protein 13B-like n=1 Tax=Salvia hispanica TaxID=49212 RepID=UPI00200961D0|nr:ankyrin repeat domain-containing protein 13B-like [Salvia hispanica]
MSKPSTKPPTFVTAAVEPRDYANSPAHYAVATRDHAALTNIVSTLPKLSDANSIDTEAESIAEERLAEKISAALDGRDNPLKETPLHIAIRLNDVASARILAAAGANIYLQNAVGWHALQEALLRRCKEIAPILVHYGHLNTWSKWRRRLPRLVGALRRMRDFYMEISFHFESSIIPFIDRVAPSDTYKIWKRAGNLRADTTLAGFDGMNFKRRNQSFLFINDVDRPDVPQGSLLVVKHDKKEVHVAEYQRIGTPLTEDEIAKDCNPSSVSRPSVDVSKAELVNCKNWRRQDRTEHVGKWKSRVYEMHNVVVKFRECKLPAEAAELSSEAEKKQPKKVEEAAFKKNLRPMLWLTEQFPLETEELHRLLDILSKKLTAVKRMREVLKTTFPPRTFPVKISIPVVPTVRVVITFTKFIELQSMEDDFHTPPSSPGPEDESSSGDYAFASSSGGEEIDPFEIPRGYTWIRNDSTSKKTRKIETTTSKKTTSE